MMADENVNTGDENKSTTVWYDFDESEDKWLPPNGEKYAQSDEGGTDEAIGLDDMQLLCSRQSFGEDNHIGNTESVAEYAQSDEGGTDEAIGQDDMPSFYKLRREFCEEDSDIGSTESVAEYAQSDEGGTDEASGQDDMQSFDEWSRLPCEEDCDIGSTESVAEYAQSDEGGTDEASGQDDMQSFDEWRRQPCEEDSDIGSTESVAEYAQSDEGGTDEAIGQDDIPSFYMLRREFCEEDSDIGSTESVAEYTQSDEGGTDEAIGQDDMPSFYELRREFCEEDSDIGSTESVAEYAQSDEGGTDEASGCDDMQSSSAKWSHPSVEDNAIGSIQLVAEAGTDEGGTGEASGQDDMQSSSDTCSHHSVEDYATSSSPSDDVDIPYCHQLNWEGNVGTVIYNILKRRGPQKTGEYIKKHLNRWKTEKIKFGVMGQAATGKSVFINKFRGIEVGQKGSAAVGFGNTTKNISEYEHPLNKNIMFSDFPGLSMAFTKEKFQEMVNLSEYSYVFLFLNSVPSEDDKWLMKQLQEKNIPFCLVRSKIDQDVNCEMGRQIGEEKVLLQTRKAIVDSLAEHKDLATVKVFLISSEKPHIGEMSNLQEHMKQNLPYCQFAAIILSLPMLTEAVIDNKLLELKMRMPYVSIGTAIIASITNPIFNISTSIAFVKREVWRYVTTFGLNQLHDEHIEGLKHNFSNEVFVDQFVESKFTTMYNVKRKECIPIFGLVFVGNKTKKIVDEFLSYVLSELKQDAYTVYMHFLNKNSRYRPII